MDKYQLRISDIWIHLRIEKMINDGELTIVKGPEKDLPVYSQILTRTSCF